MQHLMYAAEPVRLWWDVLLFYVSGSTLLLGVSRVRAVQSLGTAGVTSVWDQNVACRCAFAVVIVTLGEWRHSQPYVQISA